MLHGDICHRTSTPHQSGNKMKRKKKKSESIRLQERHCEQCEGNLKCLPLNNYKLIKEYLTVRLEKQL